MPPLFVDALAQPAPPVLPASAPASGQAKGWSLAALAGQRTTGVDKNDVSAASKFDVASLSSSRTDVSGLDVPIALDPANEATVESFDIDMDAGGEVAALADGRDSAPSLPPPPNTRKSIKLPGVATLPSDDPADPVIEPPRPAVPAPSTGIGAMFGAPGAYGSQPHGATAQPDAWASTPSLRPRGIVGTLFASKQRLAIIGVALALSIGVIALVTRGDDVKPSAGTGDTQQQLEPGEPADSIRKMPASRPANETSADQAVQPADGSAARSGVEPETSRDVDTTTPEPGGAAKPAATTAPPAIGTLTEPAATTTTNPGATTVTMPAPTATKPSATAATKPGATATANTGTATKPAVTTTAPSPSATKPTTPAKPGMATKPAVTTTAPSSSATKPAKPGTATKPATTSPTKTTTSPTKPATTKPAATTKPTAKNPSGAKPNWDPDQLFPKKK